MGGSSELSFKTLNSKIRLYDTILTIMFDMRLIAEGGASGIGESRAVALVALCLEPVLPTRLAKLDVDADVVWEP
jgi:hypothetical protein